MQGSVVMHTTRPAKLHDTEREINWLKFGMKTAK